LKGAAAHRKAPSEQGQTAHDPNSSPSEKETEDEYEEEEEGIRHNWIKL